MRTSKDKLKLSRKKKVVGMNTVLDRASVKQDRLLKAKRLAEQVGAQSKAAGLTFRKISKDVEKILGEQNGQRSGRTRRRQLHRIEKMTRFYMWPAPIRPTI